MDFLMKYNATKKGFKLLTVATIISSIVGCSSLPKEPYTYKNEFKEYKSTDDLPEGVLAAKGEDGSKIEMVVNKNHKIKLISKDSPLYDDIEQCQTKLSLDYKNVKESLYSDGGKFTNESMTYSEYTYLHSSNKEFKIVVKNCYKDEDKYKYNIQITPEHANKDIPKKITHSILDALGLVIAIPFMIVGVVLAAIVVTPIYIYFNFIHKPNF